MFLLLPALAVAILGVAGCSAAPVDTDGAGSADREWAGVTVDVRKQVGCGCCDGWAAYLREHGATVNVTEDPALDDHRRSLGVPADAAGCHMAHIDGYVVEGHVPIPAITRLLTQRPDLIGLAVPGMPGIGPGMGGDEANWNTMNVLAIDQTGGLGPFEY